MSVLVRSTVVCFVTVVAVVLWLSNRLPAICRQCPTAHGWGLGAAALGLLGAAGCGDTTSAPFGSHIFGQGGRGVSIHVGLERREVMHGFRICGFRRRNVAVTQVRRAKDRVPVQVQRERQASLSERAVSTDATERSEAGLAVRAPFSQSVYDADSIGSGAGSGDRKPPDALAGPLPAWTGLARRSDQVEDDETHVVLMSGLFASPAEAETDLLQQAADLAAQRVRKNNSFGLNQLGLRSNFWRPDLTLVASCVVRRTCLQAVHRDLGVVEATMYRLYAELDLTPSALRPIERCFRRQIGRQRAVLCVTFFVLASVAWTGLWVVSRRLQTRSR